jgi:hypothetical protein
MKDILEIKSEMKEKYEEEAEISNALDIAKEMQSGVEL